MGMDRRHKVLANRLDSEVYHKRNTEFIGLLSESESDSWFTHPCTQIILNTLSADYVDLLGLMVDGAYSSTESTDSTAQQTAKARGQLQAIEDLLEHIYDIRDNKVFKEEPDDFIEG
jgi:hypothetical protein